jgi:UDP-glucuronate decarboxylase
VTVSLSQLLAANSILREDLDYVRGRLPDAEHFKGNTIVVTGAAGFLGYFFCHFFASLIAEGAGPKTVILLDTFVLGRPAWLDSLTSACERIRAYAFNIATDELETIPEAGEAAYVLHMASIASPTFYRRFPLETVDANIWGLRRLLDYYQGKKLRGLLFFSSSEIYGDPPQEHIPTSETYRGNVSCTGPRACYDEAKRFGETLCEIYAKQRSAPIRVVRPFNNYGPGMNLEDRRLPADFAKNVMHGSNLVIHSRGTPTRTFCYVADAVVGYLLALVHSEYDVFNIGIDVPEISVAELAAIYARHAQRITGRTVTVEYQTSEDKEYLTHNPERRCPDIAKARERLGFDPAIKVDDGVGRFLEYLWQNQKNQK